MNVPPLSNVNNQSNGQPSGMSQPIPQTSNMYYSNMPSQYSTFNYNSQPTSYTMQQNVNNAQGSFQNATKMPSSYQSKDAVSGSQGYSGSSFQIQTGSNPPINSYRPPNANLGGYSTQSTNIRQGQQTTLGNVSYQGYGSSTTKPMSSSYSGSAPNYSFQQSQSNNQYKPFNPAQQPGISASTYQSSTVPPNSGLYSSSYPGRAIQPSSSYGQAAGSSTSSSLYINSVSGSRYQQNDNVSSSSMYQPGSQSQRPYGTNTNMTPMNTWNKQAYDNNFKGFPESSKPTNFPPSQAQYNPNPTTYPSNTLNNLPGTTLVNKATYPNYSYTGHSSSGYGASAAYSSNAITPQTMGISTSTSYLTNQSPSLPQSVGAQKNKIIESVFFIASISDPMSRTINPPEHYFYEVRQRELSKLSPFLMNIIAKKVSVKELVLSIKEFIRASQNNNKSPVSDVLTGQNYSVVNAFFSARDTLNEKEDFYVLQKFDLSTISTLIRTVESKRIPVNDLILLCTELTGEGSNASDFAPTPVKGPSPGAYDHKYPGTSLSATTGMSQSTSVVQRLNVPPMMDVGSRGVMGTSYGQPNNQYGSSTAMQMSGNSSLGTGSLSNTVGRDNQNNPYISPSQGISSQVSNPNSAALTNIYAPKTSTDLSKGLLPNINFGISQNNAYNQTPSVDSTKGAMTSSSLGTYNNMQYGGYAGQYGSQATKTGLNIMSSSQPYSNAPYTNQQNFPGTSMIPKGNQGNTHSTSSSTYNQTNYQNSNINQLIQPNRPQNQNLNPNHNTPGSNQLSSYGTSSISSQNKNDPYKASIPDPSKNLISSVQTPSFKPQTYPQMQQNVSHVYNSQTYNSQYRPGQNVLDINNAKTQNTTYNQQSNYSYNMYTNNLKSGGNNQTIAQQNLPSNQKSGSFMDNSRSQYLNNPQYNTIQPKNNMHAPQGMGQRESTLAKPTPQIVAPQMRSQSNLYGSGGGMPNEKQSDLSVKTPYTQAPGQVGPGNAYSGVNTTPKDTQMGTSADSTSHGSMPGEQKSTNQSAFEAIRGQASNFFNKMSNQPTAGQSFIQTYKASYLDTQNKLGNQTSPRKAENKQGSNIVSSTSAPTYAGVSQIHQPGFIGGTNNQQSSYITNPNSSFAPNKPGQTNLSSINSLNSIFDNSKIPQPNNVNTNTSNANNTFNNLQQNNQTQLGASVSGKPTDHDSSGESKTTNKCSQCEFTTPHRFTLEQHEKAIHQKVKDVKCPNCPFKTAQRSSLYRHMKTQHKRFSIQGSDLTQSLPRQAPAYKSDSTDSSGLGINCSNIPAQQNPSTAPSQNYISMGQESSGSEFTGPSSIDYNDTKKDINIGGTTGNPDTSPIDSHKFKQPNPVDSPSSNKKRTGNKDDTDDSSKKTPSSKLISKVLPKNKGKKKSRSKKYSDEDDDDEEWVADDNESDDMEQDSSDEEDPYHQTRIKVKPTFKDTRSRKRNQREPASSQKKKSTKDDYQNDSFVEDDEEESDDSETTDSSTESSEETDGTEGQRSTRSKEKLEKSKNKGTSEESSDSDDYEFKEDNATSEEFEEGDEPVANKKVESKSRRDHKTKKKFDCNKTQKKEKRSTLHKSQRANKKKTEGQQSEESNESSHSDVNARASKPDIANAIPDSNDTSDHNNNKTGRRKKGPTIILPVDYPSQKDNVASKSKVEKEGYEEMPEGWPYNILPVGLRKKEVTEMTETIRMELMKDENKKIDPANFFESSTVEQPAYYRIGEKLGFYAMTSDMIKFTSIDFTKFKGEDGQFEVLSITVDQFNKEVECCLLGYSPNIDNAKSHDGFIYMVKVNSHIKKLMGVDGF